MAKALFLDLYELTMAQVYFKYKPDAQATFDLFIRSPKRPFYVACGIDDALNYLQGLRFLREDIDYLRSLAIFEDSFLDYLRDFRFKGEVWGVGEPEIVFAQEPILRISGNLIETQIVESALLNKINLATTLASKAARVVFSAKGRGVYDFALRRTQGEEASLAAAKYSYMVGARGTSNVYAGSLYKIPVVGTMAHSFVMSFEREIESFLAFAQQFPTKSIILVDTYNVTEGIKSAIKVAKLLKRKGFDLLGIRLDSGDIASDAKLARRMLDKEGLIDTMIFASGNLDEYKINEFIAKKAPLDAFGVGTNMGCSLDLPYTDVIYKLVGIKEKNVSFIPVMKLSADKSTLPSKKQVFRKTGQKGMIQKDCIGLEGEKVSGKKLLKKLMAGGKRLYHERGLDEKRSSFMQKAKKMTEFIKNVDTQRRYPVSISKKLSGLIKDMKDNLQKRIAPRVLFMDIDTQHDFIDKKGKLYVRGSEKMMPNINKLTRFAEKNNILIFSSQDTHTKDDPEFKDFGPHCVEGTPGHKKLKTTILKNHKVITHKKVYSLQELRSITRNFDQIIWQKDALNLFMNPNIITLIETVFADKVYIYGVVTEYCIKIAVEGLLKMGFPVVVIEDAIKEISPEEKKRLFTHWKRIGVEITTTAAALKSIR